MCSTSSSMTPGATPRSWDSEPSGRRLRSSPANRGDDPTAGPALCSETAPPGGAGSRACPRPSLVALVLAVRPRHDDQHGPSEGHRSRISSSSPRTLRRPLLEILLLYQQEVLGTLVQLVEGDHIGVLQVPAEELKGRSLRWA